jgi:hypothetical protein
LSAICTGDFSVSMAKAKPVALKVMKIASSAMSRGWMRWAGERRFSPLDVARGCDARSPE